MKKIKFIAHTVLFGGALLFLQSSCSKEDVQDKNMEIARKSSSTLSQTHEDVLDFKEQYNNYMDGSIYTYADLNLDDTEWILEAAFNYDHVIPTSTVSETYFVKYEAVEDISFPIEEGLEGDMVNSDVLFATYQSMLSQAVSITNLVPVSNFEVSIIDLENARITGLMAREDEPILTVDFTVPIAYEDYHRSFMTSPNIKSTFWAQNAPICGANVSNDWSWEVLDHNLHATSNPFILQGLGATTYFHTLTSYRYGVDPFSSSSYVGPNGQDYSLSIYGAHQSINNLSFANGHWAQCISKVQMQNFETEMKDILTDHTSSAANLRTVALRVYGDVTYSPFTSQEWWFHTYEFTTGIRI